MGDQETLGWLITVERPSLGPPEVYNVAILDERGAIEAVKATLEDPKSATVKMKSRLTRQLFEALRMKPGDVMRGARPRRKHPRDGRGATDRKAR